MVRILLTSLLLLLSIGTAWPEELFPLWQELSGFSRQWYSKHFNAMHEQPIELTQSGFVHRLLWLRTFNNPIAVSIYCNESCKLTAKRLSGTGGYEPGVITETVARALDVTEQNQFQRLMQDAAIWNGQPESEINGLEGAQWILESSNTDGHVVWDIWSPHNESQYSNFQNLCENMLYLSGIEIEEDALN